MDFCEPTITPPLDRWVSWLYLIYSLSTYHDDHCATSNSLITIGTLCICSLALIKLIKQKRFGMWPTDFHGALKTSAASVLLLSLVKKTPRRALILSQLSEWGRKWWWLHKIHSDQLRRVDPHYLYLPAKTMLWKVLWLLNWQYVVSSCYCIRYTHFRVDSA